MKPLSGVDGAFLHLETPATPTHVGSLSLFDLPPAYCVNFFTRIKRQMASRLRAAPVFERKLAPPPLQPANPVGVHDDAVDLAHRVQRLTLPPHRPALAAARPGGPAWAPGRGQRHPPIANRVISSVPGPQAPLCTAGARMATTKAPAASKAAAKRPRKRPRKRQENSHV